MGWAVRIGVQPSEFWRLTPWQLLVISEAYGHRLEDERDRDLWVVWHAGALSRADHRLPPYKKFANRAEWKTDAPVKDPDAEGDAVADQALTAFGFDPTEVRRNAAKRTKQQGTPKE